MDWVRSELFTSPRERIVSVVTKQFPARTFVQTPQDLLDEAFSGQVAEDVTASGKRSAIVRAVVPV